MGAAALAVRVCLPQHLPWRCVLIIEHEVIVRLHRQKEAPIRAEQILVDVEVAALVKMIWRRGCGGWWCRCRDRWIWNAVALCDCRGECIGEYRHIGAGLKINGSTVPPSPKNFRKEAVDEAKAVDPAARNWLLACGKTFACKRTAHGIYDAARSDGLHTGDNSPLRTVHVRRKRIPREGQSLAGRQLLP